MDSLDLYASNSCPVFMRVVYWVPFRGRVNLSLSISGNRLYFIELFDSVGVGHRLVLCDLLNSGVKAYQTCPHRPAPGPQRTPATRSCRPGGPAADPAGSPTPCAGGSPFWKG